MLWLALHLPLLSLEAFCATLPAAEAARPVALIDEHRVSAVNAVAAQRGLKPGIKRATALALAGDLLAAQADARRDAAALQAVAHAALAFTPLVAFEGVATVLLEVQASLRYFGGLPRLLGRLRRTLAPLGHAVQIASAPTPLGAALLAQWRDGFDQGPHSDDARALRQLLDDAPVWLLGPGREHWEALQGMGLRTLSDLRSLPRAGLARRFGEGLLDDLDRAFGQRADPREALLPPPLFDSRLELFARADTSAQLLHGAGVLLARLVVWAQAQQARIAAFTLLMQHEPRHRGDGVATTSLRIELAEPANDIAHLQMLLRERLARVELAAPTLDLQLVCSELARSAAPNGELFPTRQSQALGLTRLLERLRARLGDAQVLRVIVLADHRPERSNALLPVATGSAAAAAAEPVSELPPERPLWLLAEPQPLAERETVPLLAGRPLLLLSGPERIESGWWDGGLVARDYFIAQAEDGSLAWIFRNRLARLPAGWFLQGRFG